MLRFALLALLFTAPIPEDLSPQIKEVAEWVDAMNYLSKATRALEKEAKKSGKNWREKLEIDLAPDPSPDTSPAKAEWEVECAVDDLSDLRTCWVRTRTPRAQLSVFFLGQSGPFILPGVPDAAGKPVTIRVDRNEAITFSPGTKDAAKQSTVADQLRRGRMVRFEYFRIISGAGRELLDLEGFTDAYLELVRERSLTGPSHWKGPKTEKPANTESPGDSAK